MLYIAEAAEQPLTQSFPLQLEVTVPPGRSLRQQPPGVTVVISGKGNEIMKLRSFPHVIRTAIPDTLSASVWRVHLQPSDVELPKGSDVQVAEIRPREIDLLLDSVASKDVKIVPHVRVEAESGYVLRGLSLVPSVARLVGQEKTLAGVDSVSTVPVSISAVAGPFFRTVPVDTSLLGVVRISPQEVRVAGEVTAIIERSIDAVAIAATAPGSAGVPVDQDDVSVSVRGADRGHGVGVCGFPARPGARIRLGARSRIEGEHADAGQPAGRGASGRDRSGGIRAPHRDRAAGDRRPRQARLRHPQAQGRPWLRSSSVSKPPATRPRRRCSGASPPARSSRASSSCPRTSTRS